MNNSISNISFGSKYVQTAKVKALNPLKLCYEPRKVSIVEIQPDVKDDIDSITEATRKWRKDSFGRQISARMQSDYFNCSINPSIKVYAITSQDGEFEYLEPAKIMCVAEVTPDGPKQCSLDYLQVNPKYMYHRPRVVKGVGKSLIDFLKSQNEEISVHSSDDAIRFYKRNDFIPREKLKYRESPYMFWNSKIENQDESKLSE